MAVPEWLTGATGTAVVGLVLKAVDDRRKGKQSEVSEFRARYEGIIRAMESAAARAETVGERMTDRADAAVAARDAASLALVEEREKRALLEELVAARDAEIARLREIIGTHERP